MKIKPLVFFVLLGLFTQQGLAAESDVSFGFGAGAVYSGLGVNIGLMNDNDFKYLAAGCPAIGYSSEDGWDLPCGVGVGWIRTDIFSSTSNKHGLGIYLGAVGINEKEHTRNHDTRYGVGLTYEYFLNGIDGKGLNVGLTPALGKDDGETKGSLFLNLGYQF